MSLTAKYLEIFSRSQFNVCNGKSAVYCIPEIKLFGRFSGESENEKYESQSITAENVDLQRICVHNIYTAV